MSPARSGFWTGLWAVSLMGAALGACASLRQPEAAPRGLEGLSFVSWEVVDYYDCKAGKLTPEAVKPYACKRQVVIELRLASKEDEVRRILEEVPDLGAAAVHRVRDGKLEVVEIEQTFQLGR